jgi:hypothetical protein
MVRQERLVFRLHLELLEQLGLLDLQEQIVLLLLPFLVLQDLTLEILKNRLPSLDLQALSG